MISKVREKQRAIRLRKKGYTYSEILKELPVAKSSLSLWLKNLPLTQKERAYLKTRKNSRISRGRIKAATANRNNRLLRERAYVVEAKKEFEQRGRDCLFMIGIALYWAEGAKRSTTFQFVNSEPEMIGVFVNWLEKIEGIKRGDLNYRLFMHKSYAHEHCEQFWADYLGVPITTFKNTVYKPTGLLIKRRPNYKGCLRIEVKRSTKLLFKMKVWQNMLANKYMRP